MPRASVLVYPWNLGKGLMGIGPDQDLRAEVVPWMALKGKMLEKRRKNGFIWRVHVWFLDFLQKQLAWIFLKEENYFKLREIKEIGQLNAIPDRILDFLKKL